MSAPSVPFAVSGQLAVMLRNLISGASDFSSSTVPTKNQVEDVLDWVSAQVEMQFQAAGYVVPLAEMSGETWPSSQTNYLTLVTLLGTAAYTGGFNLKPAPAVAPGREGGTGNIFQDLFNKEMQKIWDGRGTHLRFRANYYAGTPAEEAVKQPTGPALDFMEGYFDPTRHLGVWDTTVMMHAVQREIKDLEIDWDYLFAYRSFNAGLGSIE